jgi:formate hydrogenlyase subunit 4
MVPWGLDGGHGAGALLLAVVVYLGKCAALGLVIAVIDTSWAKLRLYKITEFLAGAFLLSVVAIFTLALGGG